MDRRAEGFGRQGETGLKKLGQMARRVPKRSEFESAIWVKKTEERKGYATRLLRGSRSRGLHIIWVGGNPWTGKRGEVLVPLPVGTVL